MKLKKISAFFLIFSFQVAMASPRPLFKDGAESFRVVDSNSKPARFRILHDSATKQSLAMAANAALKKSRGEINPWVDVQIEKIILTPVKGQQDQVAIAIRVSGRQYEIEPTIKKSDLQNGKAIHLKVPKGREDLGLFTVTSNGELKLRFDAKRNQLDIDKALAHLQIENPVTGDETEKIQFHGKGLRE